VNEITIICGSCGRPVAGDSGCLRVSHVAVMRHQLETTAWHEHHPGDVHDMHDLLAMPDAVGWVAWHHGCRPEGSDDGYEISSGELATWADLARWTAHLMSKTWLEATDWQDILREAAGEIPSERIRATEKQAA
jgi:hypothetical protein